MVRTESSAQYDVREMLAVCSTAADSTNFEPSTARRSSAALGIGRNRDRRGGRTSASDLR